MDFYRGDFVSNKLVNFLINIKNLTYRDFGQDGSIGRYGSPLRTITSKLQLKYRTTIAQN